MVLCVPVGDTADPTRDPQFGDETLEYLTELGIEQLA